MAKPSPTELTRRERAIMDVITHADLEAQSAMQADWRDLRQGQREHVLWNTALRWADGCVASISARLSSVRGADGQVEQVAGLIEVQRTAS